MEIDCDLTVIVACVEAARSVERCLRALEEACIGLRAQIIVADASRDGTSDVVRARWPALDVLRFPAGTLVPTLWSAGLRRARGRAVAFTIGHVVVTQSWARALVTGLEDVDGVGGPLVLADGARIVDWAVFYLRYSAFLPSQLLDGPVTGEIAGDNAAYAMTALARDASSFSDGFWEVEFHRRLRAEGGTLRATSQATAVFTAASPFWCIARHRYAHGRHFGAARVARGSSVLRIVGAAPFVPAVLVWRAARRVLRERQHRGRFVLALPLLIALAAAWSAGEARGALSGRSATGLGRADAA
ncbi:MAG: glycosyltransferase [Acidobacteriota bacterium]